MKKFQEEVSIKFSINEWNKIISIVSSYGTRETLQCILKEEYILLVKMSPVPYCRTYSIQFKKCDQVIEVISIELLMMLKNVSTREGQSLRDEVYEFFNMLLNDYPDN